MEVASPQTHSGKALKSINASTGEELSGAFPAATAIEVVEAVAKARNAFASYSRLSGAKKAEFLDEIALQIEAIGDPLIERACLETGLPPGRFQGERGRTTGQLRMFSRLLRDGNWVNASIDPGLPNRTPAPRPDIRRMLKPIGPVVVFTASNFPLAFSTAGGDTASALASGCPVIVKAHDSHLGVNDLVAKAILKAAQNTNMPEGVFSSLNGDGFETGRMLVTHPDVQAVAFTGSYRGGKALYDLAHTRANPIPVFAEMGSINPVILLENKLATDSEQLANSLAGSITMGVGQFCTNPGLLVAVKSPSLDHFVTQLKVKLDQISPATMLNSGITANYSKLRQAIIEENNVELLTTDQQETGTPSLVYTSAAAWMNNPSLQQEVFGPLSVLVICEDKAEMNALITSLEGQLTGTIMGTQGDLAASTDIIQALESKVGRLIFNGVPTGVEVCDSMHHGGPFPSTTDSRFTSVGTTAVNRFVRPVCLQDMPDFLLPDDLKNDNPNGIFRTVNGKLTDAAI